MSIKKKADKVKITPGTFNEDMIPTDSEVSLSTLAFSLTFHSGREMIQTNKINPCNIAVHR